MNLKKIISLIIILWLFLITFKVNDSFSIAQNSDLNNYIIISGKEYFQPYVFEYHLGGNEIYLGFLWVKSLSNGNEQICFKFFDGIIFSKEYQVTESKVRGTYYSPRACQCFDIIYITWLEKLNDSFTILLRPMSLNLTLEETLIISNDVIQENIDLKIINYNNKIYVSWNCQDKDEPYDIYPILNLIIYDPLLNNLSQPIPIFLEQFPYSRCPLSSTLYYFFIWNNKLNIGFKLWYKLGVEPGYPFYLIEINQSNQSGSLIINISESSNNILDIIYTYNWVNIIDIVNLRMESIVITTSDNTLFVNSPGPQYQFKYPKYRDEWIIKEYNIQKNILNNITIINNTQNITKSKIYHWNNNLHIIYIDNSSSSNERINYFLLKNNEIINKATIAENNWFDYDIDPITRESKCFISLNAIKNYKFKMLWCIWLSTNSQKDFYNLQMKIVDSTQNLISTIGVSKNPVFTYETISFFSLNYWNFDIKYLYDFGDGAKSGWINESIIKHHYFNDGIYRAGLKIKNELDMESDWSYIEIVVLNRPPMINNTINKNIILTFEDLNLSSEYAYDLDGKVMGVCWEFGDGNYSKLYYTVYNYSKSGIYTIRFTAWDDDGASNSTEFKIYVINRGPLANFNTSLTTATVLDDIAFTPEVFDMDGTIVQYFWDFGDGQTSSEPNPIYRYRIKGTFQITLYVIDDNSAMSNIARKQIIIENIPPQGAINVSSMSPLTFEKINLTATGRDVDGSVKLFIWDFGDGTTAVGENVSHEYRDDGTYEVKLRVIDDDFDENVTNITINVRNRGPVIGLKYEQKLMADERAFLDASGSFDPDGRIVAVSWLIKNKTINGTVVNYTFTKPGKYLVKVAVRDDDGALAEKSFKITVRAVEISRETFLFWMWSVLIVATVILALLWRRHGRG
ncbi:MAG: PKD domain-containing protein [Thermoplasmata archaeon]